MLSAVHTAGRLTLSRHILRDGILKHWQLPRPDICNAVSHQKCLALSVMLREPSSPTWCNGGIGLCRSIFRRLSAILMACASAFANLTELVKVSGRQLLFRVGSPKDL
ncbi:hypothetical protein FA95DRAFT_300993 [Auriscalpium vulgare]|uniref:Uncharacterized protein n=1 Tax=Auriscalpium vulgare TaxID=40419 RepID=A0ACB8RJ01_9AGAM|nr:hypothetical protein FA95DRAFT_300993 [Auriscalpium vulgare]